MKTKEKHYLYYSFCTEREGSWQRSESFIMSGDENKLQTEIESKPRYMADLSWEYDKIKSIEVNDEVFRLFISKAKNSIYYGDDFEIEKFIK